MSRLLLRLISILLNPLLMPIYGVLILLNSGTYLSYIPIEAKRLILTIYFISTILIPLSSFPFLYYQKIIKNWDLSSHKDRVLPLIILSGSQFFGWYLIGRLPVPRLFIYYIFFLGVMFLVLALISIKWKISIHLAGIGGLIGLIISLAFRNTIDLHLLLMISVSAAGLLAYSRLALKENNELMISLGLIIGFLLVYMPISIF